MNKSRTTALTAVALAIVPAAIIDAVLSPSAAQAAARVDYSDAFTTRAPGTASGRVFHDEYFDASDPDAKPPAVQHVHIQFPKGTRIDTAAVPLCTASDAELMAQGAAACDPKSQIGTEVFSFDTGVDGPNRIVTNDITFLNNTDELIILTQERQTGTRVVVRGQVTRDTVDFELTPLPGTPPDGGADKREDATYPVTGWLTTPPTCPKSGKWTFRVDYTFRNGEKVTRTSDSPCSRPRIAFFHRQHGRSMRVYSSAPTTARLRIYRGTKRLDDRRVKLDAGVNTVRLPALRAGTYRLTLGGRRASLRIR
jgi:hypothetical protein